MPKVYITSCGEYDNYEIVGIYSSARLAKRAMLDNNDYHPQDWNRIWEKELKNDGVLDSSYIDGSLYGCEYDLLNDEVYEELDTIEAPRHPTEVIIKPWHNDHCIFYSPISKEHLQEFITLSKQSIIDSNPDLKARIQAELDYSNWESQTRSELQNIFESLSHLVFTYNLNASLCDPRTIHESLFRRYYKNGKSEAFVWFTIYGPSNLLSNVFSTPITPGICLTWIDSNCVKLTRGNEPEEFLETKTAIDKINLIITGAMQ